MANLSNLNNKFIVTDGGNALINATANLTTYGGLTIDNISNPSIAMKTTSASGWIYNQYITNTGTNNFSMGVNQTQPYWGVKAGAGMDSPHLVVNSSGNVGIGTISPDFALDIEAVDSGVQLQMGRTNTNAGSTWMGSDSSGFHLGVGAYGAGNSVSDPNGFTVLTSGNVGINNTIATAKLQVHNTNAGAAAVAAYLVNASTSLDTETRLAFAAHTNDDIATNRYSYISTINTSGSNGQDMIFATNATGAGGTQKMRIDSGGSIIIGAGATSGTPTADYRSLEIGRQGNTITGAPWKSNLYFSTNATITAASTAFTYRYASELPTQMVMEDGMFTFANAVAGTVGNTISFTERMRIHEGGSITMGEFNSTNAPNNGILKIKTGSNTAGTCYPLLSIMGSTHLATRQYGIGMDPEGYSNRLKMFFGVDGMGNGYSYGDFVWNINTQVGNDIVSPSDEKMRLNKLGYLGLSGDAGVKLEVFNGSLRVRGSSSNLIELSNTSGNTRAALGNAGNEGDLSLYRSNNVKHVYLSSYYDSYINPSNGNLGIGTTGPTRTLDVQGPIRAGRVTKNVYYYSTTASVSNQYFHIKTNVSANNQTCMHTWHVQGYAYGSQQIIDCRLAFHTDSSNNIHGKSYLGSLANNIYKSSDNYVVLVFGTVNTYYTHWYVDLFEGMYTTLNSIVLAVSYSSNNSGVY